MPVGMIAPFPKFTAPSTLHATSKFPSASRAALREAGLDSLEIDRVDREYRMRDCERLERQAETGDIRAGQERSFGPDRALPEEEAEVPG